MTSNPLSHHQHSPSIVGALQEKIKYLQNPAARVIDPLNDTGAFVTKSRESPRGVVYVASPGCSGSSFLYDAIGLAPSRGAILKTHSFWTMFSGVPCIKSTTVGGNMWQIAPDDKVVYVYAHPMNVLLGCYRKIDEDYTRNWINGNPHWSAWLEADLDQDFYDTWLSKDVLNLERHLDKWWKHQDKFNILCLKYESLFEHEDVINNFLGFPISLPTKKERNTDWLNSPYKEAMSKTYASLIEKYEQRPDYEIFRRREK